MKEVARGVKVVLSDGLLGQGSRDLKANLYFMNLYMMTRLFLHGQVRDGLNEAIAG